MNDLKYEIQWIIFESESLLWEKLLSWLQGKAQGKISWPVQLTVMCCKSLTHFLGIFEDYIRGTGSWNVGFKESPVIIFHDYFSHLNLKKNCLSGTVSYRPCDTHYLPYTPNPWTFTLVVLLNNHLPAIVNLFFIQYNLPVVLIGRSEQVNLLLWFNLKLPMLERKKGSLVGETLSW